jgi:hypothetical protein
LLRRSQSHQATAKIALQKKKRKPAYLLTFFCLFAQIISLDNQALIAALVAPVAIATAIGTPATPVLIAATSAEGLLLALARLVDNDGTAAKHRTIQLLDGFLRFLVVAHLDEAEALAAPGAAIDNDGCRNYLSNLPEEINKVLIRRLIWQAANINSHYGLLPHDVY